MFTYGNNVRTYIELVNKQLKITVNIYRIIGLLDWHQPKILIHVNLVIPSVIPPLPIYSALFLCLCGMNGRVSESCCVRSSLP